MNGDLQAVLATFPDRETARQIATTLVEEQLAACVNLLPEMDSIYRWEGRVENSKETGAIFKTTRRAFDRFQARLIELHPYDVPECIALDVADGSPAYLRWVRDNVE